MATFSYTPDYELTTESNPDVSTVKFGDGYEQRFAKGLNTVKRSWPLVFKERELATADAIEAFLIARGGTEAFDWEVPDTEEDVRVKCTGWVRTLTVGNRYNISCTFEEVFEP